MKIEDLLIDHDSYCNTYNYDSGNYQQWELWKYFDEYYKDINIDFNLVFRWDLRQDENGIYYLEIFMINQRRGMFAPHIIRNIKDSDIDSIYNYLQKHYNKLLKIWEPIGKGNEL